MNLKRIEKCFKLENVFDENELHRNKSIARTYFKCNRASELIRQGKKPQDHDFTIIAEAMILKKKYGEIHLYTYDKHFGWFAEDIKKITGIDVEFFGIEYFDVKSCS